MKVGVVAGEPSGDYLGAGLMEALAGRVPGIEFVGVGGPLMERAGLRKMYDMERISIMGIDELLHSVRDILKIRKSLYRYFVDQKVRTFIGIDVPDFAEAAD